uniref:diacylglycerol/lipid kinase family protein n=1 Tax=Mycobacterium avium TaxID=1764 RepID=UPI0005773733
MRAVLIVNPTATSTTAAGRDLLAHALKSRLQLAVEHTNHRGHGTELAQKALADGVDLVVVHGGDGTVSGVVNGLLGRPGSLPTGPVPAGGGG